MKKLVVILLLIVVLVVALNFDGVKCADISQQCLNCICQASTGCNLKTKCQNAGENSYFCGPYLISWAYWADGGKPGNTGNSQDFEKCLTNKKCAEVAIRGYMTKWQKDCNNDGVIDCLDYAAIHKAGASGCNQQWLFNSKYWNQFRQCHIGSYGSDSYADTANDEQPQYNPAIQPRPQSQPSEYPSQPSEYQPQPNEYQPQPNAYQPDEYQPESNGYQPQPQPQPQPQFQPSGSGYRPQPSEYQPQPSQPNEYRPRPQPQPNVYRPQPTEYRPQPQPIGGNVPGRATVIGVSWSTSTSTSDNNYKPDSYESYDTYNPNVRPQRPAVQNQPSSPSQNQPEVVDYSTYREPLPANNDNVEPDYTGVLNPNPAPAPAPALEPSDTYTVSGPVGESCLECICQASTDCDLAKQCEGNFCGAYLLSWGYWADGGKPGGDYATCANNKACAERAVQGYMNKWQKDCNNDGKIDCTDFAAIHKLGPHSCGSDSLYGTKYWISYESCNAPPIDARRSPSSHSARSISSVPSVANNNNNDFISFHYTLPPNSIPEDTNYRSQPNLQPSPPRNSQPTQSRPQPQPQYEPQPQHQPQPQPQPQYQPPTQPPPPLQPRYESQPQPPPVVERMSYPASNSYFNNPVLPNNDRQPPQPQPQPPRQPPSEPNLSNSYIGITPNSDARYARNASSNRDNSEEVPRDCMDCICQASSKCNANIGCQNDGLGGFICGAYQMNWAYWSDAGKPSLNGNNLQNFQMCLNDKDCAEATVYGYMSKWKRDCNDDKQLDCFDYAAIHKAGPSNCNAQWFLESQYWSDFRECFDFRRK